MSTLNKIENAKVELVCKIEGEQWQKAQEVAFDKLAKRVDIKGFRKGKAPKHLVRQHISQGDVLMFAVDEVVENAFKDAIIEHGVELIDQAESKINSIDETAVEFVFTCPVKPDVTLGQYKDLGYKVEEVNVTDEDVEAELVKIQEEKADLEIKEEGTVENGDTVVIDFEGFKDGVAFEGGKGENYDLVIGSGSFIPGFEEQLIGMKAEEEKEINVTFPENYHEESLKGAPVTFKVLVHEIKVKVLPELDETLIAELNLEGVKTLEELKELIKKQLTTVRESQNLNKANEEVINKVCDSSTVEIPEVMIERELESMIENYGYRMMRQGMTLEMYYQYTGTTKENLKELFRAEAEKSVKRTLVLEEIAKLEKVEVSEEEVEAEIESIAKQYKLTVEEVKKQVNATDVKYNITLNKALDVLKA